MYLGCIILILIMGDDTGMILVTLNPAYHPLGCCTSTTYSLHCSSFLGLPYRILIIYLVKPKKGTTMETTGMVVI